MGMVAAICAQFGASIEADESKEAGICTHGATLLDKSAYLM